MLNRIVLIGRLTRDPEQAYATSGTAIAKFGLAVDRPGRGENREKETDFIDCVAFQQRAEFISKYARKGRLVAVEGRLQIRQWVAQDGTKRRSAEVVVDNTSLLDRPRDTGDEEGDLANQYGAQASGYGSAPPPQRQPVVPPPSSIDDNSDPFADE